jgi:acyl carrier protein
VPAHDRTDVSAFIASHLNIQLTAPDTLDVVHLMDTGLIDSVGFLLLIRAIEKEFNIELDLSDADPEQLMTVGGLAQHVSLA